MNYARSSIPSELGMISAIILAGGLGTRLRSTVPDLPKPMAPVNGRPFLEHQMDYWIDQGVRHFVLSVGYRSDAILSHFGSRYRSASIDYAVETSQLGTGGGFLLATDYIPKGQSFLLLNGDTYFAVDLQRLVAFSSTHKSDWCFALFRAQEAGRYMGLEVQQDGIITSTKSGICECGELANGGVYWVSPNALNQIELQPSRNLSLENDIFPQAITSGYRLSGIEFSGKFIDIGVPRDFHLVQNIL